jgi:hypothetical protein
VIVTATTGILVVCADGIESDAPAKKGIETEFSFLSQGLTE